MLQNLFSTRQFRLTKWSFLVHSLKLRVKLLTYTWAMIRFSNCGRLSRMQRAANAQTSMRLREVHQSIPFSHAYVCWSRERIKPNIRPLASLDIHFVHHLEHGSFRNREKNWNSCRCAAWSWLNFTVYIDIHAVLIFFCIFWSFLNIGF